MNFSSGLKILTIVPLILLFITIECAGQEVDLNENNIEQLLPVRLAGANFNGLFPQSNFKRNLGDEKGFGGGAFLLYQASALSPHFLGFDVEYDNLYSESSFFSGLEEVVSSGYVSINFNWRIFPSVSLWKIEPYVEAFLGPNFIFTSTKLLDENGASIEFDFNETNFGFEYGLGAGFIFPLGNSWFLDAQFTRTQTSIARYLLLDEMTNNFRAVNSSNDHNRLKVGVLYAF